jgi:hypothetical protein
VLASPTKFEVISFAAGIKNLLEEKKNEISSLEDNVEKMLEQVKAEDKLIIAEGTEKSIRFVLMSPVVIEQANRILASNIKNVDILMDVPWCESLRDTFYEEDKKALQRGVKYRMLISDTEGTFDLKRLQTVRKYMKETGFSLRITTEDIAAPLCIVDKKTAWLYISKETQIFKSSPLITNNERMVKLFQCYFNNLWKQAKKVKMEKARKQEYH